MMQKADIWGLVGGSGAGKSTVSQILREKGALIIDGDAIARKIVEINSPVLCTLVSAFGDDILNKDGSLCRKNLGRIVFGDKQKLQLLNEITHPKITEEILNIINSANSHLIIIDAAALLECKSLVKLCSKIIVVCADENLRILRIMNRDNLSLEDAKNRIAAQTTQCNLIKQADIVWFNNGNIEELRSVINGDYN